jgi:hypothetical protein
LDGSRIPGLAEKMLLLRRGEKDLERPVTPVLQKLRADGFGPSTLRRREGERRLLTM